MSGDASVEFAGLLTVDGSFALSEFDASAGTDAATVGVGATGLELALSVSGSAPVVGASGTLHLVRVSSASGDSTWLGVEASGLNFDLEFVPLSLAVTNGSLLLNQVSGGGAVKAVEWI